MNETHKFICNASHICEGLTRGRTCYHAVPHIPCIVTTSNDYCYSEKDVCICGNLRLGLGKCIKVEDFIIMRLTKHE